MASPPKFRAILKSLRVGHDCAMVVQYRITCPRNGRLVMTIGLDRKLCHCTSHSVSESIHCLHRVQYFVSSHPIYSRTVLNNRSPCVDNINEDQTSCACNSQCPRVQARLVHLESGSDPQRQPRSGATSVDQSRTTGELDSHLEIWMSVLNVPKAGL
jgi:hypothetical protein